MQGDQRQYDAADHELRLTLVHVIESEIPDQYPGRRPREQPSDVLPFRMLAIHQGSHDVPEAEQREHDPGRLFGRHDLREYHHRQHAEASDAGFRDSDDQCRDGRQHPLPRLKVHAGKRAADFVP
jgi:hypothetical protein